MKDCILAFDAGGTFLKAALYDYAENYIDESSFAQAVDCDGELENIKNSYFALIKSLSVKAEQSGYKITAVAVDTPGPFDYENGISLMKHKYFSLYKVSIKKWFEEILGNVEMIFMHDSTAFTSGAVSPEDKDVACVMLGTGLGFGTMKNGKILLDETGGPLNSIYAKPFGDSIAEDYVSARGIIRRYNSYGLDRVSGAHEVAVKAFDGDENAKKVYSDTGKFLAEIIKPKLIELGTQKLYLGGQVTKSFELFKNELLDGIKDTPVKEVATVKNVDLVHLKGAVKYFLKNKKTVCAK